MSSKTKVDGTERRKYPRAEVTLPGRYTAGGRRIHSGLVLSIGSDGMFLLTLGEDLPPVKATVRIETGLGTQVGTLRCAGTVVYHNRRAGTESTPGLGVQFQDLSAQSQEKIARFIVAYPGPVRIDAKGWIAWPLDAAAASTPGDGDASPDREGADIELDPFFQSPGAATLFPMPALDPERDERPRGLSVKQLVELVGRAGVEEGIDPRARVRLRFRGRRLAPVTGIPASWFLGTRRETPPQAPSPEVPLDEAEAPPLPMPARPEAPSDEIGSPGDERAPIPGETLPDAAPASPPPEEPSPVEPGEGHGHEICPFEEVAGPRGACVCLALAVQMYTVQALDWFDWRLELATTEHLLTLDESHGLVHRAGLDLDQALDQYRSLDEPASSGGPTPVVEETRSAMSVLERFLWRLAANLRIAWPSEEPTTEAGPSDVGESWLAELPAPDERAQAPRAEARRKEKAPRIAPARPPVRRPARLAELALGTFLLAATLGLGGYATLQYLRSRPPPYYATYVQIAGRGLEALRARDASALDASLDAARRTLDPEAPTPASLVALGTGRQALRFLEAAVRVAENPRAGGSGIWGPGAQADDLEAFLRRHERNVARARSWLDAAEEAASRILSSRGPWGLEADPVSLGTMEAAGGWLEERGREIGIE